jgi:hypothetical protein
MPEKMKGIVMDNKLIKQIQSNFNSKDSGELLYIWQKHDVEQISDEAFEAIRLILEERRVTYAPRVEVTLNKAPLPSIELECRGCNQNIAINHDILAQSLKCPMCNKTIIFKYISFSDPKRKNVCSVVYDFLDIIDSGSEKQLYKIFTKHLESKAKEIDANKEAYFPFGIGPFNLTSAESFVNYYLQYSRGKIPGFSGVFSAGSIAQIEDIYEVQIESDYRYYLCTFHFTYQESFSFRGGSAWFPNVECFIRLTIGAEEWALCDGNLVWVSLHPECGPFEIADRKRIKWPLIKLSKKQIPKIREQFGNEVADVLYPMLGLTGFCSTRSMETDLYQLEKELRFHNLEIMKEPIIKAIK